jgi:LysR family transcriptional regulator, transcriptional activator of the cysJI operon
MNLTYLRTFSAVADLRHFGRAAAACNLSQPAVSHQIALLEQEFGEKLFNRTARRVSLTVAGEVLLEEARRVLAAADRARERMQEVASGAVGRIRLGATHSAGLFLLPALLARYVRRHPSFDLQFSIGPAQELAEKVARNDLDMAVVAARPAGTELRSQFLCDDVLTAVVASDSTWPRRGVLNRREMLSIPWILREDGSETRREVLAWLQHHRVVPSKVITFQGPEAVRSAAIAGLGLAVLSSRAVDEEIRAGRLHSQQLQMPLPTRAVSVIDHPHKHHGAACRAMLAMLAAEFPSRHSSDPGRRDG